MSQPILAWINGRCVTPDHTLTPDTPGVFETMRWSQGDIPLWHYHWQRASKTAQSLNLCLPSECAVRDLLSHIPSQECPLAIKLYLTKQDWMLAVHPMPDYSAHHAREGVTAIICQTRLPKRHAYPSAKLMDRALYQQAAQEFAKLQVQEGILLDTDNSVIEGTKTNIFLGKGGVLYTPRIDAVGVAGVSRQWLMDQAMQSRIPLIEARITEEQLFAADEVFISNALIGLWPVTTLCSKSLSIGPLTKKLMEKVRMLHGSTETLG